MATNQDRNFSRNTKIREFSAGDNKKGQIKAIEEALKEFPVVTEAERLLCLQDLVLVQNVRLEMLHWR